MQKLSILLAALALLSSSFAFAKKTQSARTGVNTPEQELAGFTVPEGFVVELVASEKDGIVNPIDLTFDDAGRLWTQTARMYPLDPVKDIKWGELMRLMNNPSEQDKNPEFKRIKDLYQGVTQGTDDILILSDLGNDKPVQVKKFATGLALPQSILPYKNGTYVAHGSELIFLDDTDNDGIADKRVPVLTGFGFTDTHTMAHSLVRAPGGWINFSQGALNKGKVTAVKSGNSTRIDYSKIVRFSLDGNHIELITAGLNNIWGFQLRANGQWYLSEANDMGLSVTPAEPSTGFKGIGGEKLRHLPAMVSPAAQIPCRSLWHLRPGLLRRQLRRLPERMARRRLPGQPHHLRHQLCQNHPQRRWQRHRHPPTRLPDLQRRLVQPCQHRVRP